MRPWLVGTAAMLARTTLACHAGGTAAAADAQADGVGIAETGGDAIVEAEAAAKGFHLGQVDRAGRPLIAVLLVPASQRDDYNAASTFDAPLSRTLRDAFTARLHALDGIVVDGGPDPIDWPIAQGAHPLLPVLATDALLVDTALPCVSPDGGFAASYLDIEREIFPDIFQAARAHATCGGRTPSDDVVNATLALLVTRNRDGGPQVVQGVAGSSKPPTTTFPYLAAPNAN